VNPEQLMNKNDLVESLAEEFEVTKSYARDLVDSLFQKIIEAANQGEEVAIFGFGRFKVVERGARKGRNPRTGETVKIAPRKVFKFDAAKAMKEGLNTKQRGRRKAA
jgi:DNA-binding protein HU-beta